MNDVAIINKKLERMADSKGQVICKKCGEVAPYFGMRKFCINCKEGFDDTYKVDQLSLAIEYIMTFIEECDEFLSEYKDSTINALTSFKNKVDESHTYLTEKDMNSLRKLIRSLDQIGSDRCGGAIQIPKEGTCAMVMKEEEKMVSSDSVYMLVAVLMAILFIDKPAEQ